MSCVSQIDEMQDESECLGELLLKIYFTVDARAFVSLRQATFV